MPSILPGFECDIFISYRQNDNKYDGWVSEFVLKLQQELEATIKYKLTVYFDENPRDGLLETHQVDESILSKVKSLVFIPIISQTYCDKNSFAWQNEFMAFKETSTKDDIGPNVRLINGNVASRMLPIKIHEIEVDDIKLLENELKGALRSVDFIYQSSGVNRPLRPKDDDLGNNFNHTIYRNQINKVANAIKDLIFGIKNASASPDGSRTVDDRTTITPILEPGEKYSSTLPESPEISVISENKSTVYLAWTSKDLKETREEMALVLQKAGFLVLPSIDCPADDEEFRAKSQESLAISECSLHILSGEFGRRFEDDDEVSFPQFQFETARNKSVEPNSGFQTFVWYFPESDKPAKPAQLKFINDIRNGITNNMMFSNSLGPMQLVDDMRVVMMKPVEVEVETKDTDIFFIFNVQDESEAQAITDQISLEYPVETMNIQPDGEDEYRLISTQQIPKSKLAVVYFKYAADWAIPFVKQIWKQVGGASSPTPIMLVGEDEPKSNTTRTFKAPKVVSTIVPKQQVSDQIKEVYMKVIKL